MKQDGDRRVFIMDNGKEISFKDMKKKSIKDIIDEKEKVEKKAKSIFSKKEKDDNE